jgi:hypothetical protein
LTSAIFWLTSAVRSSSVKVCNGSVSSGLITRRDQHRRRGARLAQINASFFLSLSTFSSGLDAPD